VKFSNEDFYKNDVSEKELEFMDFLFKDSEEWELVNTFRDGEYGKRIGNIWYSESNFLPSVTLFKERVISKYDIQLPFDFEHVLCSSLPFTQQMKNEEWQKNFEMISMQDSESASFIQFLGLPFPYTPRIVPGVASIHYKEDSCMLICKPCHFDVLNDHKWSEKKDFNCSFRKDGKKKDNKVYRMFDFSCTLIQRIGPKKTYFSQVHLFSLGGWAKNKTSLRTIVQDRGNNLILGLIENLKRTNSIQTISDLKTKKFFEKDGIAKLLAALEEKILEDGNKSYDDGNSIKQFIDEMDDDLTSCMSEMSEMDD
jgi:hypothetical protein